MKKAILTVLVIVMTWGLCACKNSKAADEMSAPAVTSAPFVMGGEVDVVATRDEESEEELTETDEDTISVEDEVLPVPFEKFEPIVYEGTGDKIITDIYIPQGIFVATITINSEEHYSVKFHLNDDEVELLVNDHGEPYSGVALLKGQNTCEITDGILEINSKGDWSIAINVLDGDSTTCIMGTGDRVTGLIAGTGEKEVIDISIDSEEHYSVKVLEYTPNGEYLNGDLLVNDYGEPYEGECLTKLEAGVQYFICVSAKGNWTIDFGYGDSTTNYYDMAPMNSQDTIEIEESVTAEETSSADEDNMMSAESAYNIACELEVDDLTQTSYGAYKYKGVEVEVLEILDTIVIDYNAIYDGVAKDLESYCRAEGTPLSTHFLTILTGDRNLGTWEEARPLVERLSEFVVYGGNEKVIIEALESLNCVEGTFDYEAREYDFVVHDLRAAANELEITEEMLGYMLAATRIISSAPEVTFEENSVSVHLINE